MHASLKDYLRLAAPHLLPALISPEALGHIAPIAALFPPVSASGFECRLGERAPRADFGVRFLRSAGEAEILAGISSAQPKLDSVLSTDPTWQRMGAFASRWGEPSSLVHTPIHDIFFEFDVDGTPPKIPIPSFFLEFNRHSEHKLEALDVALELLWGGKCSRVVRQQLLHCAHALPSGAWLCSAGAMFSRQFDGVRLCLQEIASSEIPAYLDRVGWPGALSEIEAILSWIPLQVTLCIDVGETVLPKLGLEVHVEGSLNHSKAIWTQFLDLLVAKGLCLPDKRNAMLAWLGYTHARSRSADWPEHLHRIANGSDPGALGVLMRIINHVKLCHQPGRPLEAKGYLGFMHTWLRYDKATQRYALGAA